MPQQRNSEDHKRQDLYRTLTSPEAIFVTNVARHHRIMGRCGTIRSFWNGDTTPQRGQITLTSH